MTIERRLDEGDQPDEPRMSFFEHLEELRRRAKVVIVAFLIAFIAMLTTTLQPVYLSDTPVWVPVPTLRQTDAIPSQFINLLNESLVQGSAQIVVLSAPEAVVVQLKVAMFLAAVVTSPVMAYEFWRFVAPALKPTERRLVLRLALPVAALFIAGVFMSLLVVLPFTFPFLYGFAFGIRALPLLRLDEFLDFVLMFSLAFGVAFELPVIMYGLSYLGIIEPAFWKRNWRYAAVAIFVFGAIITPDGSGITMLLVSFPMLGLYVAGYAAIMLRRRSSERAKTS